MGLFSKKNKEDENLFIARRREAHDILNQAEALKDEAFKQCNITDTDLIDESHLTPSERAKISDLKVDIRSSQRYINQWFSSLVESVNNFDLLNKESDSGVIISAISKIRADAKQVEYQSDILTHHTEDLRLLTQDKIEQ